MCTVCGLPATHSNLTQTLGLASLFFFTLATFTGAWWAVTTMRVRESWRAGRQSLLRWRRKGESPNSFGVREKVISETKER